MCETSESNITELLNELPKFISDTATVRSGNMSHVFTDRGSEMYLMSDCYYKSANMLIDKAIAVASSASTTDRHQLIFPILNLVHHTIELLLKDLIISMKKQINIRKKIEEIQNGVTANLEDETVRNTHNLIKLFRKTKQLLDDEYEHNDSQFEFVDSFIEQLYTRSTNNNNHASTARYALDSRNQPYFYVSSSDNYAINFDILKTWFRETISIISAYSSWVDSNTDELKNTLQHLRENQQ